MKYATVEVKNLIIDKRYQRELDGRRVQKIVDAFEPRLLGTLEVARRNGGKLAVFDGQHRLAALTDLGIDSAPCLVHDNLTPQQEANLFVALQRERRNVSSLERFRARIFSGDRDARTIKKVVESAGYVIPDYYTEHTNGHRAIRAVGTLERIYRQSDQGALRDALEIVARTWGDDPRSADGLLVEGMWLLRQHYGDRIGADEIARLGEVAPKTILRRATGNAAGGGSWTAKAVEAELRKIAGVRGRPSQTRV